MTHHSANFLWFHVRLCTSQGSNWRQWHCISKIHVLQLFHEIPFLLSISFSLFHFASRNLVLQPFYSSFSLTLPLEAALRFFSAGFFSFAIAHFFKSIFNFSRHLNFPNREHCFLDTLNAHTFPFSCWRCTQFYCWCVLLLMTNGRVRVLLSNFQQATVEKQMIELETLTQSSIPHELEPILTDF